MKHIFLLMFVLPILPKTLNAAEAKSSLECSFSASPVVLLAEGNPSVAKSRLLQVWDLDSTNVLFSNYSPSAHSLHDFRKTAISKLWSTHQSVLLARAITGAVPTKPDTLNAVQAFARQRELIRPIKCLEAMLLSQQTERIDMISEPTEFIAFILRSSVSNKLRVYYYTTNEPGIRNMGTVMSLVEQDVDSGDWELWANLHNHNFFFDGTKPLNGVVAPSATDVEFFRNLGGDLGLQEAWITNGFDTLVISSRDFWKFHVAEGDNL
jgi:hypothetical protein